MNAIQAKSLTVRTMLAGALGCAALIATACGGQDQPPDTSEARCGGIAGLTCPEGKFCDYEGGSCGQGDMMGTCLPLPTACTQECVPTCGCDAKSYCSPCAAHAAGVDDASNTTCDDPPPASKFSY